MKSRLDNFGLNISSSGIKFILSSLIGFILTPIIIKNIGNEAFGLFKTIQDYIAYLMLLEFGLFGALLAVFNKIVSLNNEEEEKQVLWLGIKSYLKISLISIVVGLLFLPALTKVIKYDYLPDHSFYYSYIILLLSFITLPFSPFKSFLDASQKGYHINVSLIIQIIINSLLVVLSLHFELGVPGLCGALFIAMTISSFYLYFSSGINFKEIYYYKDKAIKNIDLHTRIKRIRKATFISNLAGRICLFTDNIIIGYILGVKFVTPFFVTQKLSQIIQTQLQSISNSSWAGLGEIYHQKSAKEFGDSLVDLTKWISILGITTLVPLVTYNESFINFWTGSSTYAGHLVTIVACLNAFFLAILTLWGWCFTATSKIHLLIPLNWTQAIVNLALNIILTYKYGIIGPILATLFSYVVINITWEGHLIRREFKANLISIHINWFLPLLYGCSFGFLWNYFRGGFPQIGIIQLLVEMAVEGGLILFFAFFLIMSKRERKASFGRLSKLLRIK